MLHVGAPKSGTTFLQRSMWARREELHAVGVRPVGERARDMFHGAIEVRDTFDFWKLDAESLRGTWERLCADARAGVAPLPESRPALALDGKQPPAWQHPGGTVVMSHELLAAATPEQAAAALAELGEVEVHLVFTVRDLGRQVPSEWQERIKNGSSVRFTTFQRGIVRGLASGERDHMFWQAHDVIDVVDRWGSDLPPERVHLVMAPPPGSPPEVLWQRFAAAVGFDGEAIGPQLDDTRSNATLGSVQVGLLRELNRVLEDRIPHPGYARYVKRYFSQGVLAEQTSPRPQCEPELLEKLTELAADQIELIRSRGYQTYGDLAELIPAAPNDELPDPDALEPEVMRDAAMEAIAQLLIARVPVPGPDPTGLLAPRPRRTIRSRVGGVVRRVRRRLPGAAR